MKTSARMKAALILSLVALVPAACRPATPIPTGSVLFRDDFAKTNSGWNRGKGTDYADGAYLITVAESQTKVWANPGRSFADVVVEVDAKTVAGPTDNDFGVQCRVHDNENYYFFLISADGFQVIGKVLKGKAAFLSADSMQPADAIQQGNAANHLRAACVGKELTLTVNGQTLAQASDDSFADGDVGLMAGSYVEPGVQVAFDNFKVSQP